MTSESETLLRQLMLEAEATIDPQSSDELRASQIKGYIQRHWQRVPHAASVHDLRLLRVEIVWITQPEAVGGRLITRGTVTNLDFSMTPLWNKL